MDMFHSRLNINSAPLRHSKYPINRAVCQQTPFFLRTLLAPPEIDINVKSRKEFFEYYLQRDLRLLTVLNAHSERERKQEEDA